MGEGNIMVSRIHLFAMFSLIVTGLIYLHSPAAVVMARPLEPETDQIIFTNCGSFHIGLEDGSWNSLTGALNVICPNGVCPPPPSGLPYKCRDHTPDRYYYEVFNFTVTEYSEVQFNFCAGSPADAYNAYIYSGHYCDLDSGNFFTCPLYAKRRPCLSADQPLKINMVPGAYTLVVDAHTTPQDHPEGVNYTLGYYVDKQNALQFDCTPVTCAPTPTPTPLPTPTPVGCSTCRGRADVVSVEGDQGVVAGLVCDRPECVSAVPSGQRWIRVGAFVAGSAMSGPHPCSTKTPTPAPTAGSNPAPTAGSNPAPTSVPQGPYPQSPSQSWCPSPVALGFDIQIETGAYSKSIEIHDIGGNIIGFKMDWRDYRYFKNFSGKTLLMIPDEVAEFIDGPSAITQFPGRYSARIVSGYDSLETPPGSMIITWMRPGWIYPARHIFIDTSMSLHCKYQKAYAGVMTDTQSNIDMLSGKVVDPEVFATNEDLCPCGGPSVGGEICFPNYGVCVPNWVFQYAVCSIINTAGQIDFAPDGYDISDLYRMFDLSQETYRFCGSVQAMVCAPWP